MNNLPKYPEAEVLYDEKGPSGNSYAILANAKDELEELGVSEQEIEAFLKEAMSQKSREDFMSFVEEYVDLVEVFVS